MRVGNRIDTVITRARMNRITKTRIWTNSRNGKTSAGNTIQKSCQSSSFKSKSNNVLLQLLNSMNAGSTSMTGEKLAQMQSQCYEYEIMGLAAERVGTHVDKLLAEGEDSLYAKEETAKDREALAREVLGFVSDYNMMMRKLAATGNSADEAYARKLKSQVSTCQDALKQLGITQDSQGILGMITQHFHRRSFPISGKYSRIRRDLLPG